VFVQFNTVTPRVMIDSLRHEGVNGKFILKLSAISSHVKLFVFPNGRNRDVVPFPVTLDMIEKKMISFPSLLVSFSVRYQLFIHSFCARYFSTLTLLVG